MANEELKLKTTRICKNYESMVKLTGDYQMEQTLLTSNLLQELAYDDATKKNLMLKYNKKLGDMLD